ncbi:MAG: family 78 glycoside hydrolase catalytic domain [Opitutaceae bacterium]|jgi:alpha-L-rhamnosidase|nr:family 78 glycoside hydrolase catalytic domain [Opitutaceae bacterium]
MNEASCFLFSYFTGKGQDGLRLATSRDGRSWTPLGNGRVFLKPQVGESRLMRDPHLFPGPGGVFHLVWTTSWDGQTIGYASSHDLVRWSEQRTLSVMANEPGCRNCWAPELAFDDATGEFVILWSSTVAGRFASTAGSCEDGYNHRLYACRTRDFITLTPARLLFDPGYPVIDGSLVRRGDCWYLVYKDETRHPEPRKHLKWVSGPSPTGPWSAPSAPISRDWVEGPASLEIGGEIRVYHDVYREKHYGAVKTRDFVTWEDAGPVSMPPGARHGTLLRVPAGIVEKLQPVLPGPAIWIAASHGGGKQSSSPAPWLRKGFVLDAPVAAATLTATALGLYECEINGRVVGDRVFAPGWTNYHKRVYCQTHDVSALLRPGENVLGAILGEGWYSGHVGWFKRQIYGDRPRFLARLDIWLADGRSLTIATDASWKVNRGPILENEILHGETYDARQELSGWSGSGYDDAAWLPVTPMVAPAGLVIEPSPGPGVKRHETFVGKIIGNRPGDSRLFDFGQNIAGRVRITVEASAGTTLKIRHSEILISGGDPYYDNLRSAAATDYYTCKGGGPEIWEPRFTFHGFRYAEVTGLTRDTPLSIIAVAIYSDMAATGHFACSNPLLNQLQSNIVWGQKGNFLDVPTDCPQRDERLGWTGDAQVFVRTAAFNLDVHGFFKKWIQDLRDAQAPCGAIPSVAPDPNGVNVIWGVNKFDGGPAWSDAHVICPWTIYLCYGDKDILADHYDSMVAWIDHQCDDWCIGHIRAHPDRESWSGFGDWLAPDGPDSCKGATPHDLIGTAFLAYDLDIMNRVARVLGKDAESKRFAALHGEVVAAFRRRFVTPDGLIVSGTQTAHVLALHFDLVPESQRPVMARSLVRDIRNRGMHLATGFVGTPFLLDVLERHGELDTACALLEQETFPSWLFPVKNGATTIWEHWDGWSPKKGFQDKGMNSFNHYAYGAVGAWMYRTVAGIEPDPAEPGYRRVIFRPHPGGTLTWAEASLKTPQGDASIRWDLGDDSLVVKFTVPEGSRAVFETPPGFTGEIEVDYGPGLHEFTLQRA